MQTDFLIQFISHFIRTDNRPLWRRISLGLILLCPTFILPTYASSTNVSLPMEGHLNNSGKLYHNPSNMIPDWEHPEVFLQQLTPIESIGIKGGNYWFMLSITNTIDTKQWTLKVNDSFVEHVQAHLFNQSTTIDSLRIPIASPKGGQFDGQVYLHKYGMEITLLPNKRYDLWINLQSRYYTSEPHFQILPSADLISVTSKSNFILSACLGSIIILALYNFLIYLWTQAKEYVYYSVYLVSVFISWFAVFGAFSLFFNSSSIALFMLPFYTSIIFNIKFYQHFLDLPQTHPVMSKISNGVIVLCIASMAVFSFVPEWVNYGLVNIVNAIWLYVGLACGIYRLYEGYKPARFFVLGFSTIFLGATFIILPYFGFPSLIKDAYLFQLVCQTLDVLFLALALADRINNLRQEKEAALTRSNATELEANRALSTANSKLKEALIISEKHQRQKDAFLIAVSHEFRTPLNAITASLSQLKQTHDPREQETLLDYIQFGTERLASQVENIVVLAELDEKEILPQDSIFNIDDLLHELEEMAQGLLVEKNIDFKVDTAASVANFYLGDRHLLIRLLAPIVDNACKYIECGKIILQTSANWGSLTFNIIDTGPGIPTDKKNAIFDSFVQASSGFQRSHEGLGLGLTISKRIAGLLQATIEYDAVIPHGCHCIVTVPMKKQDYQHTVTSHNIRSAHALIVEDNIVNSKVLQALLNKLGVSSDIAENGIVALNVASHDNYDFIFMDLQMPQMDGFSATESIRLKGIETPIIAVTANTDHKSRKRCTEVGMDDFLAKPIKKSTLQQAIQKWSR